MATLAAASAQVAACPSAGAGELHGPSTSSAQLQRLAMPPNFGRGVFGNRSHINFSRTARLRAVEAKAGERDTPSVKEAWKFSMPEGGLVGTAAVVVTNVLMAMPALAAEKVAQKGKIFDFNLTLPIIAIEFLALMVALDNIWFKPVAKVMDQRDEDIRNKLMGVRDNSGEIKQLQDEAEAIIRAARAETTASLNETKRETAAALEKNLQESKARIEKELSAALANLEEQKEETMKGLDKQVQALSDEIISKVIPFSV